MITLFESTEISFSTNGLGNLPDAISCLVTEELNGEFELEMSYPVNGKRYGELSLRRIIFVKTNPHSNPQPFRIYAITKPIDGIVQVNAEHISYDLSGYPVPPFTANGVAYAFTKLAQISVVSCPFIFFTDKTDSGLLNITKPSSIRSVLGGTDKAILAVFGGEYEFDCLNVRLLNHRGADNGVVIRYGKNLTDFEQEENCGEVYTGVYPYWYSEQDGLVELSEKYVNASGTYNFSRIATLDLSQEWQDPPSESELRSAAIAYMNTNNIGTPKISLTVSFIQLAQSGEYEEYALLETVNLGDIVYVEFPEYNVNSDSRCIKTVFDVITGKYDKIELGDEKEDIAATISGQSKDLELTAAAIRQEFYVENGEVRSLIQDANGDISILQQTASSLSSRMSTAEGDISSLELTASSLTSRMSNAEGNISTLSQTATGITSRVETAEGDITSLEQTSSSLSASISSANSNIYNLQITSSNLSSRMSNAEGNISTVAQTADKINWIVASGTTSSNFTMTSRAIDLVAANINLSGYVTFSALSGNGTSTINGSNITTGTLNASLIAANNGVYIEFAHPLTTSSIGGLNSLYFGEYCYITKNDYTYDTPLVIYCAKFTRFTGGIPTYYYNGTDYPIISSYNINNYVSSTAKFG